MQCTILSFKVTAENLNTNHANVTFIHDKEDTHKGQLSNYLYYKINTKNTNYNSSTSIDVSRKTFEKFYYWLYLMSLNVEDS